MAISEPQLDIWAKLGPTQQFTDTYASVSNVLTHKDTPYSTRSYNVRLQGSYGNDTNVYGDSDVDIVACTFDTFDYDLSLLTPEDKVAFQLITKEVQSAGPAFKREVLGWLNLKYGVPAVQEGRKAIYLKGNQNRRDADILVCTEHRQYTRFKSHTDEHHYKGIRFYCTDGTSIVNFPVLHSDNCTAKHQATISWFKPTVRIFKNMRNRMIERKHLKEGVAPSYYIEGMLWNVPKANYGRSYVETVSSCLNWLYSAKRDDLVCANGRRWLVREGRVDSWSPNDYNTFLAEVIKFWNSGG